MGGAAEKDRITWDDETVRFTCRNRDYVSPSDEPGKKVRTELVRLPRAQNDSLIWSGFQFRIVGDIWPFGGRAPYNFMIISQIHQTGKIAGVVPGQPPFAVHVDPAKPRLQIMRNIRHPDIADENVAEVLATPAIMPYRWHTFVSKVQFSGGRGGGHARCWLDGDVVLDTAKLPGWDGVLGYDHDSTLGAKIGCYRHQDVTGTAIVDFRDPEIQTGHGLLRERYAGYS